jgi:hypothetical protein
VPGRFSRRAFAKRLRAHETRRFNSIGRKESASEAPPSYRRKYGEKRLNPEPKREKIGIRSCQHEGADVDPVNDLDRDSAEELDGLRHVLKPAQERVLAEMFARPDGDFTRAGYEAVAYVSRSQAAYDLAELVKLGLVERLGSGRATRYRVARAHAGRRRKWTPERIRTELEAFCDELDGWPRASEFREAGRADLYLAASRYGGIDHWAEELGFVEADELEPAPESQAPRRRRAFATLSFATVAALALLALVLVGGDAGPTREQAFAAAPLRKSPDATRLVADRAGPPERQELALRLVAARGDSWLVVRRDSAHGRLLWDGILERGESLRFRGRLLLRLGAPGSLVARLNGERAELPRRTSTVRVTAGGIRVVSVAEPAIVVSAEPEPTPQTASSTSAPPSSPALSGGGSPAPDSEPASGFEPSPDPPPGD